MPQSTDIDLAWARDIKDSKGNPKPIHAVRWTPSRARIVRSKKRGDALVRIWGAWKERQGWTLSRTVTHSYLIATAPDGHKECIALRSYCPETLAELD